MSSHYLVLVEVEIETVGLHEDIEDKIREALSDSYVPILSFEPVEL